MADAVKPASLADIVDTATRARRIATVCVAGRLVAEFDALERRLGDLAEEARASESLDSPVSEEQAAVAGQIETLRAEMAKHEHSFTFEALEDKAWSDLLAAHPAREDRREAFNTDSFCLAACLACLIEVNGEPTDAHAPQLFTQLWTNKLSEGQRGDLFDACWAANTGRISVPFSLLASRIRHTIAEK